MLRYSLLLILLLAGGCSVKPEYQTLTYEYYVPPIEQINGEHKTIAIQLSGEGLKRPEVFPISERMRLTWIEDRTKADIQVLITVKKSFLKHNHNYYHRTTEYKDLRPMRAIHQARLKAHIQTDYEVEIRDRKKDSQLLFYQGGKQYYFESIENTESLTVSEATIVADFKKHEPKARQAVVDYLWDNMAGDRYSLLKKLKVKIMAEDFKILTAHPKRSEYKDAWEQLKQPNKKLTAPIAQQYYNQVLAKLLAIQDGDRGEEERLLIEGAQKGLAATEYINSNQYDPRIPQ